MTRRYALVQLLKHGPLTHAEIRAITGWPRRAVDSAIAAMQEKGIVQRKPCRRRSVYEVAQ